MHLIHTDKLTKVYTLGLYQKPFVALEGLDLDVHPGEIFGFLGPNGAGKTTTIKILMGLVSPTSGTAQLFGQPIQNKEVRSRIGFLPETPSFYEYLTCFEFLCFYGRLSDLPKGVIKEKARALLEQVGLASSADRPLRKLSKGMLQRVGIAQALIGDPDLVILDEPMSGLDPMGRKEMREMILNLRSAGKTVFFSSHIIHDVEMICDRIAILAKGKLLRMGPLDAIREAHETLEDCFIRIIQNEGSAI